LDSSEKKQVQTLTDLEKQHAPGLWLRMAEMVGHKRGARIGDVANQEQIDAVESSRFLELFTAIASGKMYPQSLFCIRRAQNKGQRLQHEPSNE